MFDMPFWFATFSGTHVGCKTRAGVRVICEPAGMLFNVHMVSSNGYKIGINSSEMWCCVTGFLMFGNSVMASSSTVWRFVNITEYCWTHLYYSLAPHIDLVDTSWCWLIQAPKSSSCTHITQPFAVPQVSYHFPILSSPDLTLHSAWIEPTSSIKHDHSTSLLRVTSLHPRPFHSSPNQFTTYISRALTSSTFYTTDFFWCWLSFLECCMPWRAFETVGSVHPVTQYHVPEDLNRS